MSGREALLSSGKEWLQTLAVLRAQDADTAGFEQVFRATLGRLQDLHGRDHPRWYDLMRVVLTWAIARRPSTERAALLEAAQSSQAELFRQQEVTTMGQTIADALLEEGVAKGETQGALNTARLHLRKVLEARFGSLPGDLAQRIDALMEVDRLERAFEQALRLQALADLQL